MLIKTPIVCLMFTIYMLWFYYRKPHIPIKSTRIFRFITGVTFVNVLFDLVTLYTVNHRNMIPDWVNLLAHIIYLMSILGYIFLLFLYLRSYLEATLKISKTVRICHSLPFFLSALGILVLPITYVHGDQMLLPETLLVVVASTLILLGLILSNENAEKYMDEKTSLFNQYSFEAVLEEFNFEKQSLHIAVLCFCKTEDNLDWKQDFLILQDIYREIRLYHLSAYHICENGVVFIGNSKGKTETMLAALKSTVESKCGEKGIHVAAKLLSGEETGSKFKCMQNIIAFCTETGKRFAYIDYLTHIYNRNALERNLTSCCNASQACWKLRLAVQVGHTDREGMNLRCYTSRMRRRSCRSWPNTAEFVISPAMSLSVTPSDTAD